jgi:hypothetical protein
MKSIFVREIRENYAEKTIRNEIVMIRDLDYPPLKYNEKIYHEESDKYINIISVTRTTNNTYIYAIDIKYEDTPNSMAMREANAKRYEENKLKALEEKSISEVK